MESSLIEALATGGPVAVLAAVIFLMYRRDRKSSEDRLREDRKFMEDRYADMVKGDQASREKHTAVMSELITWLKRKNGSS